MNTDRIQRFLFQTFPKPQTREEYLDLLVKPPIRRLFLVSAIVCWFLFFAGPVAITIMAALIYALLLVCFPGGWLTYDHVFRSLTLADYLEKFGTGDLERQTEVGATYLIDKDKNIELFCWENDTKYGLFVDNKCIVTHFVGSDVVCCFARKRIFKQIQHLTTPN